MAASSAGVQQFRPLFGRILSVGVWAVSAVVLVVVIVGSGWPAAVGALPWLLLLSGAVWASFWNPRVAVDVGGVHLVNVTRTIDVPWPALQAVDTKWALTLQTAYGTYTAWAAPAPGGVATARMTMREAKALPAASVDLARGIRPGDHPDSPSGAAALAVRRQWAELREAGHLDAPQLEHTRVPVRWHVLSLSIGGVLIALCVLTLLV
ncbi:PH domain-containing protein [Nakamurella alba]|nr:PH domain-containing protein [Nakamurella alba]